MRKKDHKGSFWLAVQLQLIFNFLQTNLFFIPSWNHRKYAPIFYYVSKLSLIPLIVEWMKQNFKQMSWLETTIQTEKLFTVNKLLGWIDWRAVVQELLNILLK